MKTGLNFEQILNWLSHDKDRRKARRPSWHSGKFVRIDERFNALVFGNENHEYDDIIIDDYYAKDWVGFERTENMGLLEALRSFGETGIRRKAWNGSGSINFKNIGTLTSLDIFATDWESIP